jgi:hypothetical protein
MRFLLLTFFPLRYLSMEICNSFLTKQPVFNFKIIPLLRHHLSYKESSLCYAKIFDNLFYNLGFSGRLRGRCLEFRLFKLIFQLIITVKQDLALFDILAYRWSRQGS